MSRDLVEAFAELRPSDGTLSDTERSRLFEAVFAISTSTSDGVDQVAFSSPEGDRPVIPLDGPRRPRRRRFAVGLAAAAVMLTALVVVTRSVSDETETSQPPTSVAGPALEEGGAGNTLPFLALDRPPAGMSLTTGNIGEYGKDAEPPVMFVGWPLGGASDQLVPILVSLGRPIDAENTATPIPGINGGWIQHFDGAVLMQYPVEGVIIQVAARSDHIGDASLIALASNLAAGDPMTLTWSAGTPPAGFIELARQTRPGNVAMHVLTYTVGGVLDEQAGGPQFSVAAVSGFPLNGLTIESASVVERIDINARPALLISGPYTPTMTTFTAMYVDRDETQVLVKGHGMDRTAFLDSAASVRNANEAERAVFQQDADRTEAATPASAEMATSGVTTTVPYFLNSVIVVDASGGLPGTVDQVRARLGGADVKVATSHGCPDGVRCDGQQ